ncbi:MAG: fimbrillin family protein [Bacteroidaceae bacterium]|nr:fimbrillin family protein [Bacteroidaceae bacterium]
MIRKQTKPITSWLLATMMLAGFTACQSDDDSASPSSDEPSRPLTVVVEGVTTRGTIITTESLSSFSMNYLQGNTYFVEKSSGEWGVAPASWPNMVGNNDKIDFYAYNGGSFIYNDGNPYVNFTAAETAAATADLLVAKHEQISYNDGYNGTKGAVSFTFDHACASVDFSISSEKEGTVQLKEIVLNDVKKSGWYHYKTNTWDNFGNGATTTYTLYSNTESPTIYLGKGETNPLDALGMMFFIPQTLSTLTAHYTISGANKKSTFTLNKPVEAGYHYEIDLKLGYSAPQQIVTIHNDK